MKNSKPVVDGNNFRAWFNGAQTPPIGAKPAYFKKRGYGFEKALYHMLDQAKLAPRTSYKAKGEQIDGSFLYGGQVFLLEAKWLEKELPASVVGTFQNKVMGKLIGTLGVFFSMSGFSSDAADAISKGKPINTIMFSGPDIVASMDQTIGFRKVLGEKLRMAAEEGLPYWPFTATRVTSTGTTQQPLKGN